MRHHVVSITVLAMLAAACGQYPGVHEQAVREGQIPAGQTELSGPATSAPSGTAPSESVVAPDASPIPGEPGAGPAGGSADPTGDAGGSTSSGGREAATAGNATGVTATTIKLGLHAPLTGAAPLKSESFNRGKDAYWLKGADGRPVEIHGRTVQVVFQDDQYNPSHARAVCQQMAEEQQVFALVGGGGTDQIQACAQFAASRGIPYLAVGTTEVGIQQLSNAFAVSMSYADQAPLLAQYIRANAGALGWGGDPGEIALVATNTPNFDDAVSAFQQAMPGVKVLRPDKTARGSEAATQLCLASQKQYELVFPLTSPTFFLEMAGAAGCRPQYVGVGITMGLDSVASTGCANAQSIANARFFSPAPAFADSDSYDPVFRKTGGADDIEFLLWGLWGSIRQLLEQAGPNLTREGLMRSSAGAQVQRSVFPAASFSASNHFGAKEVNVLRADCARRAFVTERAFASSF